MRRRVPALVGAPEAAEILGLPRYAMYRRPELPEPVAQLRCGTLWLRAAIEAHARGQRFSRRLDLRLAGVAEVCALLGIARETLKLRRRTAHSHSPWSSRPPRFPKPVAELRCGPVWLLAEIEAYAREAARRSALPPERLFREARRTRRRCESVIAPRRGRRVRRCRRFARTGSHFCAAHR